jgi:hypothetical protein
MQVARDPRTSRLGVFAFLWACQALVHHEFYSGWLRENDPRGWLVAALSTAVLVRPSSLPLFVAMLASSVAYNLAKWPFVVNHIFVESLIDVTILAGIGWTWLRDRGAFTLSTFEQRERRFDSFAPVLRGMLIAMYYFAILAKLNQGFLDPGTSCVAAMYGDLQRRLPFVPDEPWAKTASIWATLAIELAIPICFTFRRTRPLAILVGLPFHFMLGSIGHRTFSALALSMYSLFVTGALASLVDDARAWLAARFSEATLGRTLRAAGVAAALGIAALIALEKAGLGQAGFGPFRVFRVAWVTWGLWYLAVMAACFAALARVWLGRGPGLEPAGARVAPPLLLYAMVAVVIVNGMSQYLGLKTENAFTMYSNLRTEGGRNNHLFMPAWRLAGYQDDLVDVIATDHPELRTYADHHQRITWFELRRIASETPLDFSLRYVRDGQPHRFTKRNGLGDDLALSQRHPFLAATLLSFRPVDGSDAAACKH